jgi:hypothetical protein
MKLLQITSLLKKHDLRVGFQGALKK